jgi:hypothetical protein
MLTDTGAEPIETVATELFVESACEVAVTMTVFGLGGAEGAV